MKVEAAIFDFSGEGCIFRIRGATGPEAPHVLSLGGVAGEHEFACGSGEWRAGVTELFGRGQQPVLASAVWTAEDIYVVTLRLPHTPFYFNYVCRFTGEQVEIKMVQNVGSGPNEPPVMVGHH